MAGCVISALLHLFGQSRNRFVFSVQNDGLLITYHRQSAKIAWSDIVNVREDERGLHIKCHQYDAELPILADLDGYEEFKSTLRQWVRYGNTIKGGDSV